jgi:hypothetical protein
MITDIRIPHEPPGTVSDVPASVAGEVDMGGLAGVTASNIVAGVMAW